MKFASIDIGSNAVRLFIANLLEEKGEYSHKKNALIRLPIRLGADVFGPEKAISDGNIERLRQAMQAYMSLMKVHGVLKYKACATSAFREAANGQEVIDYIKSETGIQIDLISGSEEARIIYSNQIEKVLEQGKNALYVDVGGGSTEVSLFKGTEILYSQSFPIGTVRLLQKSEGETVWGDLQKWIKAIIKDCKPDYVIGSGGNINKLIKLSNEKTGEVDKNVTYSQLKSLYDYLNSFTYEDRISKLGLNPDRADVIMPASQIFLSIMKWSRVKRVFVPKIGLADGIVAELYRNPVFDAHAVPQIA